MADLFVLDAPPLDPDARADARAVAQRLGGRVVAAEDVLDAVGSDITVLADVWSSELDDVIVHLRARGVRVRCLADLLLEQAGGRSVAVTGTAGKTTTTSLVAQLLAAADSAERVHVGAARAGNCWPSAALLDAPADAQLVLELTSSHLVFCRHSARIAAVTSFWPDHVELHGSVAAYAAAKRSLLASQGEDCIAVLPSDDAAVRQLADGAGTAQRAWWSTDQSAAATSGPVACWVEGRLLRARALDHEQHWHLDRADLPAWARSGPSLRSVVCAVATSIAAVNVAADRLADACRQLQQPPHRGSRLHCRVGDATVELIDATLAATPGKARAMLRAGDIVVCGGLEQIAGRQVHADAAEQWEHEHWVRALERQSLAAITFGDAGRSVAAALRALGYRARIEHHDTCSDAIESALQLGAQRGARVLAAPGYPVHQSERVEVAARGLLDS